MASALVLTGIAKTVALRVSVRGLTAVAERPDGTRVNFQPYPTPVLGEDGELLGAVNMLIDVTASKRATARALGAAGVSVVPTRT